MTKHTPGPWCLTEEEGEDGTPEIVVTSTHDISGLDDDVGCLVYGGNDDNADVKRANARLIAAAPSMLAALEGLLDQLVAIGIPDWHGAEGLDLDQARAAIARATRAADPPVGAARR
ncbi:hypothetical protein [Falsiroseomonas sp. CW058]|uniref:hypothetical protein n=1 Tax=Falsiroseomonas sp. CW058 TaxID=3388664 RepID=UPI003D322352